MSSTLKIFGHKSPDTDTTCSAIIWAWYLNATGQSAAPYMLGAPNKETAYVLEHWGVPAPALLPALTEEDSVVIVDTNNPQELPENIGETNVVAIIDHHKLSGLVTKFPLAVHMRPLACTATVMYDFMGEKAREMPKEIAGLVLSCILSDTLEFRSPTTTPHDREVAEMIAKKYEIDLHALADSMFAAKSDVSDFSDAQLLTLDAKKYEVAGKNLLISSLETTNPASIIARKEGIVAAIKDVAAKEGVEDVLFFIVDILKEEATVLLHDDLAKQMVRASFNADVSGDTAVLPGVVSRKKQILPVLTV
jgi:manganese-dependent inorganic pyrophosphatase